MNKEKIENFDKEQLELLLNDLQDIDKFTGFKNGAFKYELGKYQASLLVNYIKKQKEVIDKAIDLIEKSVTTDIGIDSNNNIIHYHQLTEDETSELLDILKEVIKSEYYKGVKTTRKI